MNSKQSDRLDMYKAVAQFSDDTSAITSTRVAFTNGITSLKDYISQIESATGKQSTATAGTFTDKSTLQENLCEALFIVTSGTKAYASSINDYTLRSKMDYSMSDLRKIKNETLVPFTENILTIVAPIIASLADFGITATQTDNVKTSRDAYIAFESLPRMAVTARTAQTEALPPLFNRATDICRNILDPIAVTLKTDNPDWYNQYQNVRKVINLGQGTTTLQGEVRDSADSKKLYNVNVKVNELNTETHTDVDGNYKFSPIKRGTYTVTYSIDGYKTLILDAFEIIQGHNVIKNIPLEKI